MGHFQGYPNTTWPFHSQKGSVRPPLLPFWSIFGSGECQAKQIGSGDTAPGVARGCWELGRRTEIWFGADVWCDLDGNKLWVFWVPEKRHIFLNVFKRLLLKGCKGDIKYMSQLFLQLFWQFFKSFNNSLFPCWSDGTAAKSYCHSGAPRIGGAAFDLFCFLFFGCRLPEFGKLLATGSLMIAGFLQHRELWRAMRDPFQKLVFRCGVVRGTWLQILRGQKTRCSLHPRKVKVWTANPSGH